jgi:hypothetical protein
LDPIQIGFARLPGVVKYAPVNPVLAAQVCPYTKKALADPLLFFCKASLAQAADLGIELAMARGWGA